MLIISGGQLWDQWMGMFSPHMYGITHFIPFLVTFTMSIRHMAVVISCYYLKKIGQYTRLQYMTQYMLYNIGRQILLWRPYHLVRYVVFINN